MDTSPLVSIIVPVYNVEVYLAECVWSIIRQTYTNLEIILVNDGSTDKSGDLSVDFLNVDNRIKVLHKPNGGLSSARNLGLKNCNGHYICFLDSDDWIDEDTIFNAVETAVQLDSDIVFWSRIKEFKGRSEKVSLFQTDEHLINFEGEVLGTLKRRMVGLVGTELGAPTKTDAMISAWGKLYRRKIIFTNGLEFIDTQVVGSEDVSFNVQAFHYSQRVTFLNKHFNHYRMFNEGSLTKNHRNTLFPRFKNLYFVLKEFIESNRLSEEYIEALRNRFALSLINSALSITNKRYAAPINTKIKELRLILNDETYIECIKSMPIPHLPFVWKIFFGLAKRRNAIGIYTITMLYRKINKT